MKNPFKLKKVGDQEMIFDLVRKKFVPCTPEEWVRQQFLLYLIDTMRYPTSLVAVERSIKIAGRYKRFDILVYKNANPWMLVECKSELVVLNQQTLSQILAYQSVLQVKFLTITNGKQFFCFDVEKAQWQNDLPEFNSGDIEKK